MNGESNCKPEAKAGVAMLCHRFQCVSHGCNMKAYAVLFRRVPQGAWDRCRTNGSGTAGAVASLRCVPDKSRKVLRQSQVLQPGSIIGTRANEQQPLLIRTVTRASPNTETYWNSSATFLAKNKRAASKAGLQNNVVLTNLSCRGPCGKERRECKSTR